MNSENIIKVIKAQRIARIRQIERSRNKIINPVTEWIPMEDRTRGRSKKDGWFG